MVDSTGGAGSGGSGGGAGGAGGAVAAGGGAGGAAGTAGTASAVHANQLGYLPSGAKRATVVTTSTSPLAWSLLDAGAAVVASGNTTVKGLDAASGDRAHVVDFSSFAGTGDGFRLRVGGAQSQPFSIRPGVYARLRRDALRFFYHQRCSAPVSQPYAEGAALARAAGHPDTAVTCASGTGCSYALDVSKGWYDAGDHGKYEVNGGISLWTLLDFYERTKQYGTTLAELGDGTLNIPEGANRIADLLDEARWELEFLLAMQVPAGQPRAGMAHHKMHDDAWTSLPMLPANDLAARHLHPPSTAATLHLAATGAQCARVFRAVDGTFADRCLAAARAAFAAAQANPAVYAPATDTVGGGPYDDTDVTDELYWAAAELFLATGEAPFRQVLEASPHFARVGLDLLGRRGRARDGVAGDPAERAAGGAGGGAAPRGAGGGRRRARARRRRRLRLARRHLLLGLERHHAQRRHRHGAGP